MDSNTEASKSIDRTHLFVPPPPPRIQSVDICESSINSTEEVMLHKPPVKNDLIPRIDQEFGSLEEAQNFYENYAHESGFTVRIHSHKKDAKSGDIIRKEFVCYKQGMKRVGKEPKSNIRRRGNVREGCGAKYTVVRRGLKFVVTQFAEGHNHALTTPRKIHMLRGNRRMSVAQKNLHQQLSDANLTPSQQLSVMQVQMGGIENVGYLARDLYNCVRDDRESVSGHDANMLYEHFQGEQQNNPGFVFTIDKDENDRFTHCFWADATSRKAYKYFGDVVIFDTTYNTNRYALIFGAFVGVNHHGQTTLFGCAFLSDERVDTFVWLIKEWLKAMPGDPPKMIITDQDPAMAKAIAITLPNTVHRFCIWHIVSKFSEKLGALAYSNHYNEFKDCIWNTETPEEFEVEWTRVVQKANLSTNGWLQNMYNIRDRWVPAYTRHIFSAHMTSSQRAESCHSFFKGFVSVRNSLWDFVTRFNRGLAKLRHNELLLDHKDLNETPQLKTFFPMESQMGKVYTRTMFYKFQNEIFTCVAYELTVTHEDENRLVFTIKRANSSGTRVREVVVDKSSKIVSCSCKMFEWDGIPCRHLLAYFGKFQIWSLPDQYILQRWTTSAKVVRVMDDLGGTEREICDTPPLLLERSRVSKLFNSAINVALQSKDGYGMQYLGDTLEAATKHLTERNRGSKVSEPDQVSMPSVHFVEDPIQVSAKGSGSCKGKRIKRGKEIPVKKARKCSGCGVVVAGHNVRICPKMKSFKDTILDSDNEDDFDDGDDLDSDDEC